MCVGIVGFKVHRQVWDLGSWILVFWFIVYRLVFWMHGLRCIVMVILLLKKLWAYAVSNIATTTAATTVSIAATTAATNSKQKPAHNSQQTTDNKQQAISIKQQTINDSDVSTTNIININSNKNNTSYNNNSSSNTNSDFRLSC